MAIPVVVQGAQMMCSFGMAPSSLTPIPGPVQIEGRMPARITDIAPIVNVAPFGMCTSLANPTVAAATSAALGVLTPMPCVPALIGPWKPGAPTTAVGGVPLVTQASTATCAYGGMIAFTTPSATKTQAS